MTKLIPTRLAEVGYALVMAAFGALHFQNAHLEQVQKNIPSFFPGNASLWIYLSGIGFILAALAILINKWKRVACYTLAVMLIVFILVVHLEGAIKDHDFYQPLKDTALAMAAIMIGNNSSK
ncbi:MAG: DoxX family membrane protein [Chitinophagaceae bacterium]|nr:DoxX family membrane protein [Chitinophagaceae bacterium]